MAKAPKPVSLMSKNLTKEEIESRKEMEEKLKGETDEVYEVPKELKSKKEKELYTFLVNNLKAAGILNNLDISLLKITVDAIINIEKSQKTIKKHGGVCKKPDGTLYKNPAVNVYKDYQAIYHTCCLQLGLSPSSRAKLALLNTEGKKDDPLLDALEDEEFIEEEEYEECY